MTDNARMPYSLAVLLVCAVVGLLLTLCDRFSHVQFGVLSYTDPVLFGQAWWAWPNFTGAALGMYLGVKFLFVTRVSRATPGQIAFSVAWFTAAYFATGILAAYPHALLAGLLLAWAARVAIVARDRVPTVAYSLVLGALGCLIEGAMCAAGWFAYRDPEFFNVPLWLFALYMNGSFIVLQVVRTVEEKYGNVPGA